MNHGLERVLEFLDEPVGLQNIDDSNKQKEPLPLVVPGRDPPRGRVMDQVHRVTCRLQLNIMMTKVTIHKAAARTWMLSIAVECATSLSRDFSFMVLDLGSWSDSGSEDSSASASSRSLEAWSMLWTPTRRE